jgi:hypothetical protein
MQRQSSLFRWISSHGSSLTRLELIATPNCIRLRQLACPNLQELVLTRVERCPSVQLWPGSKWPGLLHSCTALTRLKLGSPSLLLLDDGVSGAAAGVSAASAQLQEFAIDLPCRLPRGSRTEHKVAQALDQLLPYLTSLTCLDLGDSYAHHLGGQMLRSGLVQRISTLVRLNRLQLHAQGEGCSQPGCVHMAGCAGAQCCAGHLGLLKVYLTRSPHVEELLPCSCPP